MRVVVLGGSGVFGSRLVRLLSRDGHEVLAAGRGEAGLRQLSAETGCGVLVLDRRGDLAPLWAAEPEVVVDAAGPFHAYGNDPWRLARDCIAHRVHYLDLADDGGFCAGIAALDAEAKASEVVVLSGVSSVPCLSSAAVAALSEGFAELDLITSAILPGNRAPRGRSVVESILHQAGTGIVQPLDGRAERVRSWSDPRAFDLSPGMRRLGYVIEVPDQRLLAPAFGARTVEFRAGMELSLMNRGLAALSWARGWLGFGMPGWLVGLVRGAAVGLSPFGSDAGGMVVEVTGRGGAGWERRRWVLVAGRGEGPFVPAVAARAVLRELGALAPGARPAVAVLALDRAEAAMGDLEVVTRREVAPVVPLFAGLLGPEFARLAPEVRASHDHAGPRRWVGKAEVERGRGLLARAIAFVFGFPAAGSDVPVAVVKRPVAGGEVWERRFGAGRFRSWLGARQGRLVEQFGPFAFDMGLQVRDGALHWPVVAGRCLGVPLPRWCLPRVVARETEAGGQFRFHVEMHAPFGGGLIVAYRGWLAAAGPRG